MHNDVINPVIPGVILACMLAPPKAFHTGWVSLRAVDRFAISVLSVRAVARGLEPTRNEIVAYAETIGANAENLQAVFLGRQIGGLDARYLRHALQVEAFRILEASGR